MFTSKEVILYGAGSDIKKALKLLEEAHKIPLCITDSSSEKWGGYWRVFRLFLRMKW